MALSLAMGRSEYKHQQLCIRSMLSQYLWDLLPFHVLSMPRCCDALTSLQKVVLSYANLCRDFSEHIWNTSTENPSRTPVLSLEVAIKEMSSSQLFLQLPHILALEMEPGSGPMLQSCTIRLVQVRRPLRWSPAGLSNLLTLQS